MRDAIERLKVTMDVFSNGTYIYLRQSAIPCAAQRRRNEKGFFFFTERHKRSVSTEHAAPSPALATEGDLYKRQKPPRENFLAMPAPGAPRSRGNPKKMPSPVAGTPATVRWTKPLGLLHPQPWHIPRCPRAFRETKRACRSTAKNLYLRSPMLLSSSQIG